MRILLILSCLALTACASTTRGVPESESKDTEITKAAFASSYAAPAAKTTILRNATIWLGEGNYLPKGDIVLQAGKIKEVGVGLTVQETDFVEIDATGRYITPGLIDVHSHLGVYPSPAVPSHADGNEMVSPNTAAVWAEHSVWPQDPGFEKALAGGVTTLQVLPGSANLFGGRGVTLKNIPAITMMEMKFPDAPHALKMACGENPKRVYGEKGGPMTRMGNVAGYRKAWIKAQTYKKQWDDYQAKLDEGDKSAEAPQRDLEMETLMGVLNGEIRIHNHCYRADEMATMIELAKEFDYEIAAFHHAVEAYKVAPLLAENDVCAVVWADWWGFKQEAFDMVRENAALVELAGACAIIHSDDDTQIQRLNQEVAKVWAAANRMGMSLSKPEAIKWLTANAAKSLGLDDRIGKLEAGLNADVVLWSGDPFSVYTKADQVWIDGVLRYHRENGEPQRTSDFNLGILSAGGS